MSRNEPPSGQRQLRVGEEVRHAIAWTLERGDMRDPALAGVAVTVTEVRLSPDLRQATVYIMPLGGHQQDAVLAALQRGKGFLRRQIAASVHLKFVPDLTFRIDRSFDEAERIRRALRQPSVARDLGDNRKLDSSQDKDRSDD